MHPKPDPSSLELLNMELENYFSNTIIPQLFFDGKGLLHKFTPPAMKQFSLSASDLGKSIEDLADNIRFPGMIENIQQVIRTRTIVEKEVQTTDLNWYQMNILPYIIRSTGEINGVIITFVDITDRIYDLRELEKLISEHQILIDAISHDLKNPLASILMAIELLKVISPDSPDMPDALAIIERSARRIRVMIDELNNLRKESSIQNEAAELLNIENILEDVCLSLTKQIQESGARITNDIEVSQINYSRRKMRSITYNLISNALKYRSPERSCLIEVCVFKEGSKTMLQIKDNGIGIPKEKQEAIFDKYYRANESVEGTGIGLYLVKEILRSTGGHIVVESDLNKGAVFTVQLTKK